MCYLNENWPYLKVYTKNYFPKLSGQVPLTHTKYIVCSDLEKGDHTANGQNNKLAY